MSTPIKFQTSVPFPIVIISILHSKGDVVEKFQPIFKYKYVDFEEKDEEAPPIPVDRIGTFESPLEGEIDDINIRINQKIDDGEMRLFSVKESCTHTVQYEGLCALCGKAIKDEKNYTGYTFEDRATISMSYDNRGLKISLDEATKLEETSTTRLSKEKKLILVVDLDQTVIHATVDPTVGEWQSSSSNPNYNAVKDVEIFTLVEEPILPLNWMGPKILPSKCTYYVKVRPGLKEFLEEITKFYELHIYTMATRNYALSIAKIIDPDGKYFGDRILSRDESGSLTHKNLKRLFPVDQSMVVIIDDRGDVWQWESNLIKVIPYDFFVGIGDINSSFLPKKNGQLTGPGRGRKSIARLEAMEENEKEKEEKAEEGKEVDISPVDRIIELAGGEGNRDLLIEQSISRNHSIEQQMIDRPLARLQHDLEMLHRAGEGNGTAASIHPARTTTDPEKGTETLNTVESTNENGTAIEKESVSPGSEEPKKDGDKSEESGDRSDSVTPPPTKDTHKLSTVNSQESLDDEDDNLLYDDDTELFSLKKVLINIHGEYYKMLEKYEESGHERKSRRRRTENGSTVAIPKPDLTHIIPEMKSKCLTGIVILFSGIIPIGLKIETADIVIWCKQFGVQVVTEVYPHVTHVVCRDPTNGGGPTFKARVAKKMLPHVKIVNPDWLFACLSRWTQVDETEYLIGEQEDGWKVNEKDIANYQKALERLRVKVEEYNLDDANQEVDDFLADTSDDEADDADEVDEIEAIADETKADIDFETESHEFGESNDSNFGDSNTSNILPDISTNSEDTQPSAEPDSSIKKRVHEDDSNGVEWKRQKNGYQAEADDESGEKVDGEAEGNAEMSSEELDELEKELLDGFDDLED